jgi:hypothetical protein
MALVNGRGDDEVDRAALVLKQDEGDPIGGLGALAGGNHAGDLNRGTVAQTVKV